MEENQKKIQNDPDVIELNNDDGNGGEGSSYTTKSGGAGQSSTTPFGIRRRPPPPFLEKTYEMVENEEIKSLVSWSSSGTSIIIWNHNTFAATVLTKYFGSSNFQSFVCQLNSYGFKKISCMRWEFKNEYFRKGQRHLLQNIKRRTKIPKRKASEIDGELSNSVSLIENELEKLTKEHDILKLEMSKLQEQHHILKQSFDYLVIKDQKQQAIHSKIEETIQKIMLKCNEDNGMLLKAVHENEEILIEKGKEKEKVEEKSDTTRSNRHDEAMLSEGCGPVDQDGGGGGGGSIESIVEVINDHKNGKIAMMEEEAKSDMFTLECLIEESSLGWAEFVKQMM
ncbi:hypothetical protein ACJIZ3_005848 [Penstemon smallii]|uniref:HSF-type DNA-binding domain-containing protein n=1 Tax=Penstemon smallii TaxID=265156 RepID=A0ABD3S6H8_9LAMI